MSKCTTTHNKYQGNLFMFCVFKNKIPNNKLKSLLRQLVVFVLYCSNCSKEELYTTMLELNRYIMFQQPVYNIVVFLLVFFLFIYLFLAFLANKKDSVPIKDLQEILYLKVFKIPGSHKKRIAILQLGLCPSSQNTVNISTYLILQLSIFPVENISFGSLTA